MVYMDAEVTAQFADPSKAKLFKNLGFETFDALKAWITTHVIPGIENRIATLTGRTWTESDVPEAVKQLAHQAGANLLLYLRANQMGPLITNPQGFNLEVPIVHAFTPEMLAELEHYKEHPAILASSDYKTEHIKETWEES